MEYVFQAVATRFAADRDDAISKINRALESPHPETNVETVIYENIRRVAISKMCLQTLQEELSLMNQAKQAQQGQPVNQENDGTNS